MTRTATDLVDDAICNIINSRTEVAVAEAEDGELFAVASYREYLEFHAEDQPEEFGVLTEDGEVTERTKEVIGEIVSDALTDAEERDGYADIFVENDGGGDPHFEVSVSYPVVADETEDQIVSRSQPFFTVMWNLVDIGAPIDLFKRAAEIIKKGN